MTKIAAMLVYIFLAGTKKADDLESWYAASGARVLSFVQMMTLSWAWPN